MSNSEPQIPPPKHERTATPPPPAPQHESTGSGHGEPITPARELKRDRTLGVLVIVAGVLVIAAVVAGFLA